MYLVRLLPFSNTAMFKCTPVLFLFQAGSRSLYKLCLAGDCNSKSVRDTQPNIVTCISSSLSFQSETDIDHVFQPFLS